MGMGGDEDVPLDVGFVPTRSAYVSLPRALIGVLTQADGVSCLRLRRIDGGNNSNAKSAAEAFVV